MRWMKDFNLELSNVSVPYNNRSVELREIYGLCKCRWIPTFEISDECMLGMPWNVATYQTLACLPACLSLSALTAIHSFCLSATVLLDMNAIGIADAAFLLLRQDYSESQTYYSIKRLF